MNVTIYLKGDDDLPADGGIPLDTEKRKPSPATEKLLEEIGRGVTAKDAGRRTTEGGKPVSPERSRV